MAKNKNPIYIKFPVIKTNVNKAKNKEESWGVITHAIIVGEGVGKIVKFDETGKSTVIKGNKIVDGPITIEVKCKKS